jgi:Ca2+/Na+ antiporter
MKNFIGVKNLKKTSFIVVIVCNILTAFLLYLHPEKVNIFLSFLNLALLLLYLFLSVKKVR